MTPLTKAEIQVLAQNAGFSGSDIDTASAIALAESSGAPGAIGDITRGVSVGLWQINVLAHPEWQESELLDPATNARAAFSVFCQANRSFSPWTTFRTGAYKAFLDDTTVETDAVI